jgi:hypothetical protein
VVSRRPYPVWGTEAGSLTARSGIVDLVVGLDIYGGTDASGVLDPVARSLVAAEKRQDKQ